MDNKRLLQLLTRYQENTCTEQELAELEQWYNELNTGGQPIEATDAFADEMLVQFREKLAKRSLTIVRDEKVRGMNWKRWVAAASILVAVATVSYLVFFNKGSKPGGEIVTTVPKDVKAPETNRAMITLADGRSIYLDSALNGELVTQGNIKLVKLANGQIAYQTADGASTTLSMTNTLSNPRGSKVIDMQLSDGSHVWLNAGSSVTYPIAFVGDERKVTITGEAYFEIAHDKTKPFIVSANDKADVTVLGTHFNVNAYDDESDIKITLLEGSVKVSKEDANNLLKPGQQARVTTNIKVVSSVDLDEVMAWKNGNFQFGEASIEEVMRQVSRWYDVEVIYESKPTEHFRGEISRDVEVSKVLKMLETTEAVHFRIEGKKVYVTK